MLLPAPAPASAPSPAAAPTACSFFFATVPAPAIVHTLGPIPPRIEQHLRNLDSAVESNGTSVRTILQTQVDSAVR